MSEAEDGVYKYKWQSVTLEPGVWAYSAIVNAIVTERYKEDAMQAIINNYLSIQRTEEHEREMRDMQEWRDFAKNVARECIKVTGV